MKNEDQQINPISDREAAIDYLLSFYEVEPHETISGRFTLNRKSNGSNDDPSLLVDKLVTDTIFKSESAALKWMEYKLVTQNPEEVNAIANEMRKHRSK